MFNMPIVGTIRSCLLRTGFEPVDDLNMKNILVALTFLFVATGVRPQKDVTAEQVNGTWKNKTGEFKIWRSGSSDCESNFWNLQI